MTLTRTISEGWPALMSSETAARYLSLEEHYFSTTAARMNVCPVDLQQGKPLWRKSDLDALIRRLPEDRTSRRDQPASLSVSLDEKTIAAIAVSVARQLDQSRTFSQPELVSIKEVSNQLGLGRSTIYTLIAQGELKPRHIGRRTLISRREIEEMIARR